MKYLLFAIFFISGFSGLIYESIWSHYLKLFLGHAAYAQSLVLAIFMGGMAAGAWLAGKYSFRIKNLIIGYAIVEGIIGFFGIVFHKIFTGYLDLAYLQIIPWLDSVVAIQVLKWGSASLLILPQSILLGMTFPLMSGGIIRLYPQEAGKTLAMLYFTNSFGAAIGVLASGFFLIAVVGLPGTILTAGLLNIFLAIVVWFACKFQPPANPIPDTATTAAKRDGFYVLMLTVAALTGLASFIYEIVWIRMLNLVLGSSTHAFELMLSAFIFGLAFGGLWIRRRIQEFKNTIIVLAVVQCIMGILALLTLPAYNQTFDFMVWLLQVINRTEGSYLVFNLVSQGIAMFVMFPASFCAGMTLPLITYTLIKRNYGEKSIGMVYGWNTAGSILGVIIAVHLALPLLGIKGAVILGGLVDITLGLVLLWRYAPVDRIFLRNTATAVTTVAVIAIAFFVPLDIYKLSSGVYRMGILVKKGPDSEIIYYKDGKTTTVAVYKDERGFNIRTNGKVDGAIRSDIIHKDPTDEPTMVLSTVLPLSHFPAAKTAAIIGIGTGMSTHTMLLSPMMEQVDTIEIEPAMVEGARLFGGRNKLAFEDSRSRIYYEDAKIFFSNHKKKYDIILSEPSNPWVSGVSSLFTDEFYSHIKKFLTDDGILAQWIQLYEINQPLVASVVKALSEHFEDYQIYLSLDVDMIIVAKKKGKLSPLTPWAYDQAPMRGLLASLGISKLDDLRIRRLGEKSVLDKLFLPTAVPINSDYFPYLDLQAAKTRFLRSTAAEIVYLPMMPFPLMDLLEKNINPRYSYSLSPPEPHSSLRVAQRIVSANSIYHYVIQGKVKKFEQPYISSFKKELAFLMGGHGRLCKDYEEIWFDSIFRLAEATVPFLTPEEGQRLLSRLRQGSRCGAHYSKKADQWFVFYSAVARRDASKMVRYAKVLLEARGYDTPKQHEYLVVSAMAGQIANNDIDGAASLWKEYAKEKKGRFFYFPALRLLLGYLELHEQSQRKPM